MYFIFKHISPPRLSLNYQNQTRTFQLARPVSLLCILFHILQCRCNTCTNTINNDMIHFHIIMWSYWFIDFDFTCFSPLPSSIGVKSCLSFTTKWSIAPKPTTCPSRLQPVHQAKSCLDLLHLDHMTNVMSHVQWAPSSSHVWASQHLRAIFTFMAYVAHTHVPMD